MGGIGVESRESLFLLVYILVNVCLPETFAGFEQYQEYVYIQNLPSFFTAQQFCLTCLRKRGKSSIWKYHNGKCFTFEFWESKFKFWGTDTRLLKKKEIPSWLSSCAWARIYTLTYYLFLFDKWKRQNYFAYVWLFINKGNIGEDPKLIQVIAFFVIWPVN
jgi:hypothetical protein